MATSTITVNGTPVSLDTNIALGKDVSVSSEENPSVGGDKMVDDDTTTRWSSGFSDNEWAQIDLGKSYTINKVALNWEASYAKAYKLQTSMDGNNWDTVYETSNCKGGEEEIVFDATTCRYVRMQGVTRALPYGYSLWEMEVYGTGASSGDGEEIQPSGVNVAKNASVSASGAEAEGVVAKYAVDGNTGSRWSSNFADDAWISVDLGKTYTINKVVLNWEGAYGKEYKIQTSSDEVNWTTVKNVTDGAGGVETITFTATDARYVKLQGVKRALPYGYSLWELEIYTK